MLTLKTLTTRVIAISALGLAMTAPVIAATESTDNTLNNNPAGVTAPAASDAVNAAPNTQALTAEEAAKAAAAEADAAKSTDAEANTGAK